MQELKGAEKEILSFWDSNRINEKIRKLNSGKRRFYFLDGPPYVTGDLHPGHIWVKSLKDIFVRYKRYRGFDVVDKAGYDVHGLPIENKVEKELGITSKKDIETKIGVERFVSECGKFVAKYMGRMDADYKRYGISLDFQNPYLPFKSSYIETAWGIFKSITDNGFLYEGTKTLIYCPHCETPLSQGSMEVEYRDEDDPSIYIAFKIDAKASRAKIEPKSDSYLLVWTTTPWTIPSNMAIAANPRELYVEVKMKGKTLILAKKRLEQFSAIMGESVVVLREFYGGELENMRYLSPLEDRVPMQKEFRKHHKVIMSEGMVSMEDGSGLVHIAPGNGVEDYSLGVQKKIPIFSPVNPDSTYNGEAGAYAGLGVPAEANKAVMADLEASGALLHKGYIRHSYPHCWRCANKLIFLATKQWFLNIRRIKKRLTKANERVSWHPEQVRKWQNDILENSPDWCISRQRYWGIPMPIWICGSCKEMSVIGSFAELRERAKDRGYASSLSDYHRPHIDKVVLTCPKCGGDQNRIKDIFDVWFDSSIAFRASLTSEEFGKFTPTDLVVEYIEQIRGWFQYMLKIGAMAYRRSPFDHIMVHGIMAGNDGRKMSKSFGNYRPLGELAEYATADAFRLWSTGHDQILNRNLSDSEIKDSEKSIVILHNVANLLEEYEKVLDYKPKIGKRIGSKGLDKVDAWILSRLEAMIGRVTASLDSYNTADAVAVIEGFIIEDLSRFYLKSAKKRLGEGRKARKMIDMIDYMLFRTIVTASPIIPFVAEGIYQRRYKRQESVFMEQWPKQNKRLLNKEVDEEVDIAREAITAILNSREKKNVKLRSPILSATIETASDRNVESLQRMAALIEDYTNAKRIVVLRGSGSRKEIKPLFGKIGPAFKEKAGLVAEELKKQDAEGVESEIARSGYFSLHTGSGTFDIRPEHFATVEKKESDDASAFKYGLVTIDPTQTEEMREELLAREVARRVQILRKEMGLTRVDKIVVYIYSEPSIAELIKRRGGEIRKTVNARMIEFNKGAAGETERKEWDLEGAKVGIAIRKE
ncbi:MAG: isoleucine--tRNA ligase [Candidatus Micrarchaeota archaeon]|nr:isoleucine--tRNA ligase [Candidatus Micrarchaeota archaeon]